MKLFSLLAILLVLTSCKYKLSEIEFASKGEGLSCYKSEIYKYEPYHNINTFEPKSTHLNRSQNKGLAVKSCEKLKSSLWQNMQSKMLQRVKTGSETICEDSYEYSVLALQHEDESPLQSEFQRQSDSGGVTNVQVAGVDESDIVKVTKKYIVASKHDSVQLVDKQTLALVNTINTSGLRQVELFYLHNQLVIMGQLVASNNSKIIFFQEEDDGALTFIKDFLFNGRITMARSVGDSLYFKTQINHGSESHIRRESGLREVYNHFSKKLDALFVGGCSNFQSVTQASISLFQMSITNLYKINLKEDLHQTQVSLLGNYNSQYVTENSIYLTNNLFLQNHIVKIDIKEMQVKAEGEFKGRTIGPWSYGEVNGILYVAMTMDRANQVKAFIDNGLGELVVAKTSVPFARGEAIKSVRYEGEKAYVVTFLDVDPLFVLDLAQEQSIPILGALKVPGYSLYMHKLEDDLLVGLGFTSNARNQVQLSLFDVRNNEQPQVLEQETPEADLFLAARSEVFNTHQAFFKSKNSQLFGFPVQGWSKLHRGATGALFYKYSHEGGLYNKVYVSHVDFIKNQCGKKYLYMSYGRTPGISRIFEVDGRLFSLSRFGLKEHDMHSPTQVLNSLAFSKSEKDCYEPISMLCSLF